MWQCSAGAARLRRGAGLPGAQGYDAKDDAAAGVAGEPTLEAGWGSVHGREGDVRPPPAARHIDLQADGLAVSPQTMSDLTHRR